MGDKGGWFHRDVAQKLADEADILFWEDALCGKGRLCKEFPGIFLNSTQKWLQSKT